MKTTKKPAKEVIVIARYTIKRNGAVIYRVRSNQPSKDGYVDGRDQVERNGQWYDVYQVCVNEVYVCGCTCKASEYKGVCCHRKHVQAVMDAKHVVSKPAQPVESTKVTDMDTRDVLNGTPTSNAMPAWLAILPSRQKLAS